MATFKHITYAERTKIEVMYNNLRCSVQVIADTLGFHVSTIYRELKRGAYERLNGSTYEMVKAYSSDIAQQDYDRKGSLKGASLKIGKDFELVEYIEDKILNHKYSPGAVLGEIRQKKLKFKTTISKTTLYRYIDDDLFLHISNKHLHYGKREQRKYRKTIRIKRPLVRSIEERPKYIEKRKEFGHWEMDTVIGRRKGRSTCLLVMTERKTRKELIFKLHKRSTEYVVRVIDKLERKYKGNFSDIFKSFTVDNGSEFMDTDGIEKNKRTTVYYCHPFCSYERGSNENANRFIRRFVPKGESISRYTHNQIERLEHWVNNYPRRMFNYNTSEYYFTKELETLAS